MEKIYMEENKSQKQRQQQDQKRLFNIWKSERMEEEMKHFPLLKL